MKIELYLEKINQEMIGNPQKELSKSLVDGCCIYAEWSKSCCILDFSMKYDHSTNGELLPPEFILRSEPDGGMLWNPNSGSVYKLDKEAYNVLVQLESGLSEESISEREKIETFKIKQFKTDFKKVVNQN